VEFMMYQKAAQRHVTLPKGFMADADSVLHKVLPPGAMQRKAEYDALHEQRCADGEAVLADLDHRPGYGPTSGAKFPTCLTHSCVYSWHKRRLALASESLAAQGIDMFPALSGGRKLSPLKQIFDSLSERDVKFLAGNAMHVPTFTMWMVYVFGNCAPVYEAQLNEMCGLFADDPDPNEEESSPTLSW
jgi:hypothetical protein